MNQPSIFKLIFRCVALLYCMIIMQHTNAQDTTRFGAMINGDMSVPSKIAIINSLGAKYTRTAITLQNWSGADLTYEKYRDANINVALNINWYSHNLLGAPVPFPTNLVLYKNTLTAVLNKYPDPAIVVIENEETQKEYHSGAMNNYVAELYAAIPIVHGKGLKVTNGGIHPQGLCYWVWKDYVDRDLPDSAAWWKATTFSPQMNGGVTNPTASINFYWRQIDTLLRAYDTLDIDYVNMHYYEPINSAGDGIHVTGNAIKIIADYVLRRTGKRTMTNETGQENEDPVLVNSMLAAYAAAKYPYVIWWSGDGSSARALNQSTGVLRENGNAYRSFVANYTDTLGKSVGSIGGGGDNSVTDPSIKSYKIVADRVDIEGRNGRKTELVIKNNTQNIKGFLYNLDSGLTSFKIGVDSIWSTADSLKWRFTNGSAGSKGIVAGATFDSSSLSYRINRKVDSLTKSNDSVYCWMNGSKQFSFKDSSGSAAVADFIYDYYVNDSIANPALIADLDTNYRFLVADGALSAFAGHAKSIATWTGAAWSFTIPTTGQYLYNPNGTLSKVFQFDGAIWQPRGKAYVTNGGDPGLVKIGSLTTGPLQLITGNGVRLSFDKSGNARWTKLIGTGYRLTQVDANGYFTAIPWATLKDSAGISLKLNIADSAAMLYPYLRKADTTSMLNPYLKKADTLSLSNRINLKIDSIRRSNDTVYQFNNGIKEFAYKDSIGSSSGGGTYTIGNFSNTSNSKTLDITGTVITAHAGDTTNPGSVIVGPQDFKGLKRIFNSGIGTTSTAGLVLSNAGTATNTLDQWSPALEFRGSSWKTTATAAARDVNFRIEEQTVNGTTNGKGNLVVSISINGGTFVPAFTITETGQVYSASSLGVGTAATSTALLTLNDPAGSATNAYGLYAPISFSNTSIGAAIVGQATMNTISNSSGYVGYGVYGIAQPSPSLAYTTAPLQQAGVYGVYNYRSTNASSVGFNNGFGVLGEVALGTNNLKSLARPAAFYGRLSSVDGNPTVKLPNPAVFRADSIDNNFYSGNVYSLDFTGSNYINNLGGKTKFGDPTHTAPNAHIDNAGSINIGNIRSITAAYTVLDDDCTLECDGTFNVTLLSAAGRRGRLLHILNVGSGTITVLTTSSQTIGNTASDPASITINPGENFTLQSNNTKWRIL